MKNLIVSHLKDPQLKDAQQFYQNCGYKTPILPSEKVVVAKIDKKIVGVVRICHEEGVKILRGMQVDRNYLRCGIGRALLLKTKDIIKDDPCYCIPHKWLEDFYGIIEFKKIEISQGPEHLQNRLRSHKEKYPHLIMMRCN